MKNSSTHKHFITRTVFIDLYMEIEKDISYEVTNYGPLVLAGTFIQYNVISSNHLELIQQLIKLLPSDKVSVVLMDIITDNVKDPVTYEGFLKCLEEVSSLKHLHKKFKILGKYVRERNTLITLS